MRIGVGDRVVDQIREPRRLNRRFPGRWLVVNAQWRRMWLVVCGLLLAALVLSACGDDPPEAEEPVDQQSLQQAEDRRSKPGRSRRRRPPRHVNRAPHRAPSRPPSKPLSRMGTRRRSRRPRRRRSGFAIDGGTAWRELYETLGQVRAVVSARGAGRGAVAGGARPADHLRGRPGGVDGDGLPLPGAGAGPARCSPPPSWPNSPRTRSSSSASPSRPACARRSRSSIRPTRSSR